ncbi:hypothetical protein [Lactococcus lactis]|uniref:hypothetical protein n=1 Tax=Lactococcus lactis TaxID=1358 RepID=UPI001F568DA7|nr:hypothetical protein [Lactococcus lactis]
MFKRKKIMTLCATTLAGLSALGSFAPMAASADVAKNGDTVVTYESTKTSRMGIVCAWNNFINERWKVSWLSCKV